MKGAARRADGRDSARTAWVVYLGTTVDPDDLALAAVTGSEPEAWELLTQARRVAPDRSNLIEDRPFVTRPAPGRGGSDGPGLRSGEQRTVLVLLTGTDDATEVHAVFERAEEAIPARDHLVTSGAGDARLHEVVTNTWLLALPT